MMTIIKQAKVSGIHSLSDNAQEATNEVVKDESPNIKIDPVSESDQQQIADLNKQVQQLSEENKKLQVALEQGKKDQTQLKESNDVLGADNQALKIQLENLEKQQESSKVKADLCTSFQKKSDFLVETESLELKSQLELVLHSPKNIKVLTTFV